MSNNCVCCGAVIPEGRQVCPGCEQDRNERFEHAFSIPAKKVKKAGTALGVIMAIIVYLAVAALSWIFSCGIIKLITLCFGLEFSWAWATGIWLVLYLLKSAFATYTRKVRSVFKS